jgi:teichuronic acid biosynthesis glycosyltransferase TuaG
MHGGTVPQKIEAPLVSTFVPTYNGAEFISQTIESVLEQTYDNFELIVVDDHSSDNTVAVVETFARKDTRVKIFTAGVRRGPCHARNVALSHCSGSLLCWLDQDDLWMPDKLAMQVSVMARNADVGLVYTYFDAFDSETKDRLHWPDGRRDFEGDVLTALFALGCFIGSSTCMFRREVFGSAPPHLREREFSFGDDYYLWLTIALRWRVARIPQVLAAYRRHASNESTRVVSKANVDLARANLVCDFLKEYPCARARLGDMARVVPAFLLLLASRFERDRHRRLRAARLIARAARNDASAPVRTRLGAHRPERLEAWLGRNAPPVAD